MADPEAPPALAGRPGGVAVPASVGAVAAGRPVEPVWQNQAGGVTFFVPTARLYVKWSPAGGIDLAVEADRMRWAYGTLRADAGGSAGLTVPRVLAHGSDAEGNYLVTRAIPGDNAVADRWRTRPAVAAAAVGAGLRRLHDTAPVQRCPYRWSTADRLADIASRRDQHHPLRWHPEHHRLTVDEALALLADPPPVDRLVVCHGDACCPNTLLDDSGRPCALVDLGSLGVGDRWADLAVATWSLTWNHGPGWETTLLDAYGVDADPERTAYYRLLWDLGP